MVFLRDNFNSHAHVERDCARAIVEAGIQISTHTLTWSVTYKVDNLINDLANFNSHAHVERDSSGGIY